MIVGYQEAVDVFDRVECGKMPSLHPYYVVADALRDPALTPCFYIYENKGHVFYHGFHLSRVPGTCYFDIQSPYGYSGPLTSCDDPSFLASAWSSFSEWCHDNMVLAEFVRFHPLLTNWRFFHGETVVNRQTIWIDLTVEDLMASYETRTRTTVRKARKNNLVVQWGDGTKSVELFDRMYSAAMREIGAENFYLFPAPYHQAFLSWERSLLAVCTCDTEVVAASLFLVDEDSLEYHLSFATVEGRGLGASTLLLHEAASYGKKRGCTKMHLGGGTNDMANNPLFFFKCGFSALRASFVIGKRVHQESAYREMKREWEQANGKAPSRILFYR